MPFSTTLNEPKNRIEPIQPVTDNVGATLIQAVDRVAGHVGDYMNDKQDKTFLADYTKSQAETISDPFLKGVHEELSSIKAAGEQGGGSTQASTLARRSALAKQALMERPDLAGEISKIDASVYGYNPVEQAERLASAGEGDSQKAAAEMTKTFATEAGKAGFVFYKTNDDGTMGYDEGKMISAYQNSQMSKRKLEALTDNKPVFLQNAYGESIKQLDTAFGFNLDTVQATVQRGNQLVREGNMDAVDLNKQLAGSFITAVDQQIEHQLQQVQLANPSVTPDDMTALRNQLQGRYKPLKDSMSQVDEDIIGKAKLLEAQGRMEVTQSFPLLTRLKELGGPQLVSLATSQLVSNGVLNTATQAEVGKLLSQSEVKPSTEYVDVLEGKVSIKDVVDPREAIKGLSTSLSAIKGIPLTSMTGSNKTALVNASRGVLNATALPTTERSTINASMHFNDTWYEKMQAIKTDNPEGYNNLVDGAISLHLVAALKNGQTLSQESTQGNYKVTVGTDGLSDTPSNQARGIVSGYKEQNVQVQWNNNTNRFEAVSLDNKPLLASLPKDLQSRLDSLNGNAGMMFRLRENDEGLKNLSASQIGELLALNSNLGVEGKSTLQPEQKSSKYMASILDNFRGKDTAGVWQETATNMYQVINRSMQQRLMNEQPVNETLPNGSNNSSSPSAQTSSGTGVSLDAPTTNSGQQVMALSKSIVSEEGVKDSVYVDSTGNKSVGIGFNLDANGARKAWKDAGITEDFNAVASGKQKLSRASAEKLYAVKHDEAHEDAQGMVSNWNNLGEYQKEALTSMVYQMGAAGVRKFKTTLARIEKGDFQGAAQSMLASAWAKQTPQRAQRVAEMMASNVDLKTAEDKLVQAGTISAKNRVA